MEYKEEKCVVCGGEIPRSLLAWLKDVNGGTPEEAFWKGRYYDYFLCQDWTSNRKSSYDERIIPTKLYLSRMYSYPETYYDDPVCLVCWGKGYRKCVYCEDIYKKTYTDEELESYGYNFDIKSKSWYPETDCDQYISGGHFNTCDSDECNQYREFLHGNIKYKGYTKDLKEVEKIMHNGVASGSWRDAIETAKTYTAVCLLNACIETSKRKNK